MHMTTTMASYNYQDIAWNISKALDTAIIYDDDIEDHVPIPDYIWDTKLDITEGDRVTLMYIDGLSMYNIPVKGTTLKDLLTTIDNGLNTILTQEDAAIVDELIMRFKSPKGIRQLLRDKFAAGTLIIRDLIGDYCLYEGGLVKNDGIWEYNLAN